MDTSPGAGAAGTAVTAPGARELYGLYKSAMTGRTDEWEANLTRRWGEYEQMALADGRRIRDGLLADLERIKTVDKVLQPEDLKTIMSVRARADETLWEWNDKQMKRLQLWPDPKEGIEVYNRKWDATRSIGNTVVGDALDKVKEAAEDAGVDPDDIPDDWGVSHVSSWADNIIRAVEQATYQVSAHIIDATSGPNALAAIEETAELFTPPMQLLELSFMTHPRAAFRSGLGLIGRELDADSYVYHLPTEARANANPFGFGAAQHGKIRTAKEWERVRQNLDHKRPGSYVWTTGFHVGDKGYLIPIPPDKAEGAVAYERRERQKWLAKVEARKRAG